jgi:ATP-dependent Clp protease ATP-binding subunit ClpA
MTYGVETSEPLHQYPINGQTASIDPPREPPHKPSTEEPSREAPTGPTPTDNLAQCLNGARDLAARLNHPQIDLLHVVAAMALEQNGRIGLRDNAIDFETAHVNSLSALVKVAPICPRLSAEDMHETHELLKVRDAATAIANERDPEHRTISIDDFVKALLTQAPETTLHTVRGARVLSPEEKAFKDWQNGVEASLSRIEKARTIDQPEPANDNIRARRLVRVAGIAVLSVGVACLVYLTH